MSHVQMMGRPTKEQNANSNRMTQDKGFEVMRKVSSEPFEITKKVCHCYGWREKGRLEEKAKPN